MRPRHAWLGVLIAALWGLNFVAAHIALAHLTPLLLAAARFAVAALPALVLPRPPVPWPRMLAVAAALFVGQFAFLYSGMHSGMPAGLASVVIQAQAVLTAPLAAAVLGEPLGRRRVVGLAVAACGLAVIGSTVGTAGVTGTGLVLTLLAALAWATGNILLRGAGPVDMLALVCWLSLLPPLPLLGLSLLLDGPGALPAAVAGSPWLTAAAVLYIAVPATVVGYGLWGHLLRLYPAGTVAPFALLVPPFGLIAASVALGEEFEPRRVAGIALVGAGLAIGVLPWQRRGRRNRPA